MPIVNGYTQHDLISHNQIDHVGYSGISMGWGGWPDKIGSPATPNDSHDNTVSDNLITDYMQGLDDGGGIYTQGLTGSSMATGEKVTGNVIHTQFGLGKSVYTDNGCTYETVSGNVLYGASYANVASTHVDYRDTLHNNDPTLISGNWWEQGDADGSNKGVVTQGNHLIASASDAPAGVVADAGLEPAYRSVLARRFAPVSVPVAPTSGRDGRRCVRHAVHRLQPHLGGRRFGAAGVPGDGRGPRRAHGGDRLRLRRRLRRHGAGPAHRPHRRRRLHRDGHGGELHGDSAPSLPSAPLAPKAATVPAAAPTGLKLKAQATAATLDWTPPTVVGDSPVIGYRITVTDPSGSRTVDVAGRDVLVTQPSAHAMFRVLGDLTPGTPYTVGVAAVTGAGTGPAATVTGTTPAA